MAETIRVLFMSFVNNMPAIVSTGTTISKVSIFISNIYFLFRFISSFNIFSVSSATNLSLFSTFFADDSSFSLLPGTKTPGYQYFAPLELKNPTTTSVPILPPSGEQEGGLQ
jgi:hypothetical protein